MAVRCTSADVSEWAPRTAEGGLTNSIHEDIIIVVAAAALRGLGSRRAREARASPDVEVEQQRERIQRGELEYKECGHCQARRLNQF